MLISAESLLQTVSEVLKERESQHGSKHAVFDQARLLWTAYLGIPISSEQVAILMVLLKVARSQNGASNPDDFVDAVGYMALAAEMRE